MFPTFKLTILALALTALVAATPIAEVEKRVLPSGHPIIDNDVLSKYSLFSEGYQIQTAIYPSGFDIPTETITALPSGYSVAWDAVYDPEGHTVSAFPSSALTQVVLEEEGSTSASSGPSPADDESDAAYVSEPSIVLAALLAACVVLFGM